MTLNKVVSIITPSFNRADIIHETAQSIFSQTYSFWEWVIVDDGSIDDSWALLQKYAAEDPRVKILRREREPKGAAACRNIAVQNSSGAYLVFLDTDDLMASFCLEQRVRSAEEDNDCDFIIFPMLLFKNKPDDLKLLWNIETGEDDINRFLSSDPICQGTGTIWKKDSFERVGMWDETLLLWQDIELHLRVLLKGLKYKKRMDLLPDVFLRISDVSLSRTGFNSLAKLKSRIQVFTQTTESILRHPLVETYHTGLRNMGLYLILTAIRHSYFTDAKQLISFGINRKIFTNEEASIFAKYLFIYRVKIYKFQFIEKSFVKKINTLIPQKQYTLGAIGYTGPVIL